MGFRIRDREFYLEKDPKEEIVQSIAQTIKTLQDYEHAYTIMVNNAVTLEDIIKRTVRLKTEELIKLADLYISK